MGVSVQKLLLVGVWSRKFRNLWSGRRRAIVRSGDGSCKGRTTGSNESLEETSG